MVSGSFRGLLAEAWGQSDLEGISSSVATPVEKGASPGLDELREPHHPFFWDHVGAVSGAGRWEVGPVEEDLVPAVLGYCHLIDP